MRYEQNLQAQLRERYRQLFKAGFVAYRQHTNYYRQFILKTPVLAAIVENIQRLEPDIDPDQWYREHFQFNGYDLPESEAGLAKLSWRIIERIASGELDALQVSFTLVRPSNNDEAVQLVTERLVEPFVNFLESRIGTEN